jgi:PPK2 family polyphosphate:nucleotide phosphotransferase
MLEQARVEPGSPAGLAARDTADKLGLHGKVRSRHVLDQLRTRLDDLHNRLWAEAKRSVLLVLQGMDTAGKDGAIRMVLSGLNPQGCTVATFKAPSDGELAHDYLWRVHEVCPPRGRLGVFNRSHYEDVVAARVIGVVTPDRCQQRYRHITEFERMLHDEGTTCVKVFLHLSKDEQRARLQARIDEPSKNWKFKRDDLDVRSHWDEYQAVYEEVITATSTEAAPWYVIPADHKWVRDVAIATLLVDTFEQLDPRFPPPDPGLVGLRVE